MEKFFGLKAHGTKVQTELLAGFTTFLTMAYILAVNPAMLGGIGKGMTPGAVFTATAIASGAASIIMALLANLPIALAPGMGVNSFFTFTVVTGMGYPWQLALTAVFLAGIVFLILSLLDVRKAIIDAIPVNLKKAIAVGMGLFIAFIGLVNAGIVIPGKDTILVLGKLSDSGPLLAIVGFILIMILYSIKIPGSIFIGILTITVISVSMGLNPVPRGWVPVSLPAAPLFFKFDWNGILNYKFFTVFFTFLFVNIFDTVGTLVGVCTQANLIDKKGNVPRGKQALLSGAIGTVLGAVLGTSTVTSYIESATGVAEGGRTGLTALSTGVLFLLALFLAPLFQLIPASATAPAMIFAGFLMMAPVTEIKFSDPAEGIPCFLTIAIMPFAYSIDDGIVYGISSYVLLKTATGKFRDIPVIIWVLFVVFVFRIFTR
ncbi:MAG: NCS2 family permease [Treponema sp.]|nr:NCS2 family permease [Treponema sp.]